MQLMRRRWTGNLGASMNCRQAGREKYNSIAARGSRRVSHATRLHLRTQNMQRTSFRCIDARNCERYVAAQRHAMLDPKQRVALSSIAASAGLTAAKAIVGVMSGSLALLSEAAHSLIDLGATVMTYFAV